MTELKPGSTKTFRIENQDLIVEPIPYGNLKRILKIVTEAAAKLGTKEIGENFLTVVPKIFEQYIDEFIPLLFKKSKHPFLNKEWVDENMTVPLMKEVVEAAIAVNGMKDFFGVTVKVPAPQAVLPESGTKTTPSENSGSTISSGSPTDGDPETSTPSPGQ